jgi:hypothetical protein
MLAENVACFPHNVIDLLCSPPCLPDIDPGSMPGTEENPDGLRFLKRPLRSTDYTETIGLVPLTYAPQDTSYEMQGEAFGPTLHDYGIAIQFLVKDSDEPRAIRQHSYGCHLLRHKLYHDPAIRLSLPELAVTLGGTRERFQKMQIGPMNFMNNELGGSFMYLSTVELTVTTEKTKV